MAKTLYCLTRTVLSRGLMGLLPLLCPCTAVATPISGLTPVYEVNFDDGTLNPSLDALGIGPLQISATPIAGTNPAAVLEDGGLTLGIPRPAGTIGPVGVGAWALVSFGQGSILGLRAVYELPVGPHDVSQPWAAALNARTDFVQDLQTSLRANATFQTKGDIARLNTVGSTTPANMPPIPQSVYDSIFFPGDPATFTLELVVDRITGAGFASLSSGDFTTSRSYLFSDFGADFGPAITAIGPSLAVNGGVNTTASVRVLDFQLFTQPVDEAPTWMFFGSCLILLGLTHATNASKYPLAALCGDNPNFCTAKNRDGERARHPCPGASSTIKKEQDLP